MGLLRRFGGAIVLLLSTAWIVGCVAGVIGVWVLCQKASDSVQTISARLDVGLRRASAANQNVRRAVGKARADVAEVGKESADLSEGGEKGRRASRALRTLIQQRVGPDIGDLGGRLATSSDAAVAVSSLLQSIQELPPGRTGRIEPDQLERWGDGAQRLSASLRRLEAVVGDGDNESSGSEVAAATSKMDLALQKCQVTLDDWQSDLDAAREELPHVRAGILGWLKPTAIAVTLLCVWMAAGQISLLAHSLPWCRGRASGAEAVRQPLLPGQP